MKDDMERRYKKMMNQVPVRTERIKDQISEERWKLAQKENRKHPQTYNRAIPISILIVIILLMVSVLPEKNQVAFTVYASEGTKVELNREAVKLYKNLEFDSAGVSGDSGTAEFVYSFDIECEGKNLKKITYIIEGEETVSHIKELSRNQVWFAEVINENYDSNNYKYPFVYRSYGEQGKSTAYAYLGSRYSVEANKQRDRKYCIEYRVKREQSGNYEAKPFDIRVVIEKTDGSILERKLHFEPKFNVVKGASGIEFQEELWVSER